MSHMDTEIAGLLRAIDPAALGSRLRNARVAKGLTQAEVAGGDASTGYISRIEAGQRRPDGALLERIAGRLDTSVEGLVMGVDPDRRAEVMLDLDYAELALASGDVDDALARTAHVLALSDGTELSALRLRARHLNALALEGAGRLEEAIVALEDLLDEEPPGAGWLTSAIALSRCYRESGDLARAIDTGESALRRLENLNLDGVDEAIRLAVTVAAAYFERGDASYAVRLCHRIIERAEGLESATAKAAAYWNASVMESRQGAVDVAVSLAQKALVLMELGDDRRNVARLRSQLGISQLRLNPPALDAAQANLEQASRELEWSSASRADTARNQLALARVNYLSGDLEAAGRLAADIFSVASGSVPLLAADALVLSGQIAADQGDLSRAKEAYREAILTLSGVGADRSAAQLWFELGDLLEDIGASDEARDAYRRAAVSTGLSTRQPVSAAR